MRPPARPLVRASQCEVGAAAARAARCWTLGTEKTKRARGQSRVRPFRKQQLASMRERAVFIGSTSVWDTIGTLQPSDIEIVTLFRPVYCCVMGRKAPRKRLACRVISAFTRVL